MNMNELGPGTHKGDLPKYDLGYWTSELQKGKYCMILFFKFQIHAKEIIYYVGIHMM